MCKVLTRKILLFPQNSDMPRVCREIVILCCNGKTPLRSPALRVANCSNPRSGRPFELLEKEALGRAGRYLKLASGIDSNFSDGSTIYHRTSSSRQALEASSSLLNCSIPSPSPSRTPVLDSKTHLFPSQRTIDSSLTLMAIFNARPSTSCQASGLGLSGGLCTVESARINNGVFGLLCESL